MSDRENVVNSLEMDAQSCGHMILIPSETYYQTIELIKREQRRAEVHERIIERQPEIVRCKDCMHFDGCDCKVNDIVNIMDTEWFCADGVRKER